MIFKPGTIVYAKHDGPCGIGHAKKGTPFRVISESSIDCLCGLTGCTNWGPGSGEEFEIRTKKPIIIIKEVQ